MGIGQRNMGPRNMQQSRPFMGMSSAPRELTGHMRPNGCPGVGLADPQAIQERLIPGQQHPGQQPPFQPLPTCPPLQPHPGLHHQSSPPHPHHQPWAQLHPSPQNTPQKVPVHQGLVPWEMTTQTQTVGCARPQGRDEGGDGMAVSLCAVDLDENNLAGRSRATFCSLPELIQPEAG
ncbi:Chromodomain-helicase-DNA-binding protein 7 [Tupaia chinensis]|uniref:Chromodomain-helicase-DNA-binding protein 7 n=1 Tax=Tupaia chinensis TaxID=246437 RepID=L9KFY5_TUPCH|nr:Chromodomain-helicase-DNA-binding protein 7 [Tupaia chinensis]